MSFQPERKEEVVLHELEPDSAHEGDQLFPTVEKCVSVAV
jgi:hypothetical protein